MTAGMVIAPAEHLFAGKGRGRPLVKDQAVFKGRGLPGAFGIIFRLNKEVKAARGLRGVGDIRARHGVDVRQPLTVQAAGNKGDDIGI